MRYKEALNTRIKPKLSMWATAWFYGHRFFHSGPAPPVPANYDIQTDDGRLLGYISIIINKERALLEQHRAAVAFIIVLIGVQLNLLFTFRLVKTSLSPLLNGARRR